MRTRSSVLTAAVWAGLLLSSLSPLAHAAALGENSELEIGGYGAQPGQFDELRDLAFDAAGQLYTLEGVRWDANAKAWRGNGRIQKFDPATGKLVSSFSVRDAELGQNEDPQHLACDGAGRLYVTQPRAGIVQQFAPDGTRLRSIALPRARVICRWRHEGRERIAVIASNREVVPDKGWTWKGGEQIDVLDPATGTLGEPIKLQHWVLDPQTGGLGALINLQGGLEAVTALTADPAGNFYVLAAVNQIFQISPKGELLKTIGAGTNARNADGSEPLHTLALDSQSNLYSMTCGNPGLVTRYDAAFTTVTQREGQFKWADPWSVHSSYTVLACDPQDRLWVATTHVQDPKGVNYAKYHATPCVLRVQPKFLDAGGNGVVQRSALLLGLAPSLTTTLPYSIAYDLRPVPVTFAVAPATRQVRDLTIAWRVQDTYGQVVATGRFDVPLADRAPAQHDFTWTPPRLGWYSVTAELLHNGQPLRAIGKHFGITPRYPGMVALTEGESAGGWADAPRQMFAGLTNVRLHAGRTKDSLAQLEKQVELARKYRATFFVQFSDKADCTADNVRAAVTRLKGQVPVWEIMNEPNFTMKPEDYVRLLQELRPIVREIDPQAQVMGPDVCGLDLSWHQRFYQAGGGALVDILSVHDYEGHESLDPVHWRWKYGALRELMAQHGDAAKPLWQTERAITGIRGDHFLGPAQAVRCTLHRDLLETLGIAPEHNNHYYLNEGGYGAVPSYIWSSSGPHPAALALRTRYALTLGRRYVGTLDFGPTGNRLYLGLRYEGPDGTTLVLRNLGDASGDMALAVQGGTQVMVTDAFGNEQTVPIRGGTATVTVGQLPVYVRLAPGQTATPPKLDFGRNLAPQATLHYSAPAKGDLALLTNGILETIHAGNPNGGTDGKRIWQGELPLADDGSVIPQTLDLTWPAPRTLDRLILWGVRADNQFCALLDYDVQYHDGRDWRPLKEVRAALVPSAPAETSLSRANTWLLDDNLHVHEFAPITTDRLRVVARRTTRGFVPDAVTQARSKAMAPKLMLREIEVYGPAVP